MEAIDMIFYIAILLMSVVIHEISHGFVAEWFGDKTARFAGRLTLNPLKHLDFFGSFILPAVLYLSTKATGVPLVFGYAKPVPYNPANLSNEKWGTVAVSLAGVLSNFFIAILFGLVLRFTIDSSLSESFYNIISIIVFTNLFLAVFNLVPIPPLDGSKVLFALLPLSLTPLISFMEKYSLILFILFLMSVSNYLLYPVVYLFALLVGVPLS